MTYRRRQQGGGDTDMACSEEIHRSYYPHSLLDGDDGGVSSPSASSIAAKAIRASSAYRDSSLSSAYGPAAVSSPRGSVSFRTSFPAIDKGPPSYKSASVKSSNEIEQGFWGVLARKAKNILDDDSRRAEHEVPDRTVFQLPSRGTSCQYDRKYQPSERRPMTDGPTLQKGLGALASSLDYIGGRIGNALEEGLSVVENRTADIYQETRKFQMNRKGNKPVLESKNTNFGSSLKMSTTHTTVSQMQTDLDIQLKASRDVAMAMAAKAKLLLRELKTAKADLAFAKERCSLLEEENRFHRESREKGDSPEDDDLIRLQLESLLAEKARLAQENSVFARENRFLREIVEYHQLTMQDVVYLDEYNEEMTEVYPVRVPSAPNLQFLGMSSSCFLPTPSPPEMCSKSEQTQVPKAYSFHALSSLDPEGSDQSHNMLSSYIHISDVDTDSN